MKKSLVVRLSLRFMIIVAASLLILSIIFIQLLRLSQKNKMERDLSGAARFLSEQLEFEKVIIPEFLDLPYFITFLVYQEENQEVYVTNDPFLPCLPVTQGKAKKYFQRDYFTDGDLNILYCAVECQLFGKKYVVETAMDIQKEFSNEIEGQIAKVALIIFIPILIISYLLSFLITKQTIKPVEEITLAAQKMSFSNLESLLPVSKNDDELDQLAKTFNTLFESLRKDFDRERSFTSDVSHELKTPVAGILGQANLLKRWGKDDPKQLESSLEMIITEANAMNSIITNLLQMSKIEHGIIKPQSEEFNLWALFSRLKNEFAAINPQLEIFFDENIDLSLKSDLELLHQVLTAMISNSIKFGAGKINLYGKVCEDKNDDKGGQTPNTQKICIQVEDDGPGFSEEALPHVFERFYRGDVSHSRSAGGAGLGLSISSVIIQSLGGTISAANSPSTKGAILTILL